MFQNFNFYKNKKLIIVVSIIVVLGIFYFIYNNSDKDSIDSNEEIMASKSSNEVNNEIKDEENDTYIVVHVSGEVIKPGIVKLKEGSRIEDAIEAAGGLTNDANISNVNLAYVLDDGIKIVIPKASEDNNDDIIVTDSGEGITSDINDSKSTIININKASQEELEILPGIGASLAERIVNYRDENGKFSSIEDIKNVNGIGDSKFENIKNLISVK